MTIEQERLAVCYSIEWYGWCIERARTFSAEPSPLDRERIVDSGAGRLIAMEE